MPLIDVVEDDPGMQRLVTRFLEAAGHQVRLCGDLEATQGVTLVALPDLLITDLGLPDGCGLELVRRVRQRSPRLPVLVISGGDGPSEQLRAYRAGASDYLAKPFRGEELLVRCAALLERARAPRLVPRAM